MFKREHRFSFRKGIPNKAIHSKSFVLRYGENDEFLKVAVVVGKKVDKRAVRRNSVKRGIVRILESLLDTNAKNTILVFAKKQIAETDNESLRQELKQTLENRKQI